MKRGTDIIAIMEHAVPQLCAVCGRQLTWSPEKGYYGDFAHVLNNTKANREHYKDPELWKSKYIGVYVCADNNNKCKNQVGVNHGSQPVLADQIVEYIRQKEASDERS